jgi:sulfate-transporting ATPase
MTEFTRLFLLGLGAGSLYALAALGLVLVYRSSGLVNFAHGGAALLGAFAYWGLTANSGWAPVPALLAAVGLAALLGLVAYEATMVLPRGGSTLTRVVATLAVLLIVSSVALLRYGQTPQLVSGLLPTGSVDVLGAGVGADRLILLGVTVALTAGLGLLYSRTKFGIATTAVSERPRQLAALGWRVGLLQAGNWAIGGALGGLAGALIAPISGVSPTLGLLLTINALAAALIGRFSSFPLTLAGGLLIGVLQAELAQHDFGVAGLADAVPFLVIIGVLVLRGNVLPSRGTIGERLPRVGSGRVSVPWLIAGCAALAALIGAVDDEGAAVLTTSLLGGIVVLSLVVVLGYAGQLSLAQVTLSGVGALAAGRLAHDVGLPFELAVPLAALATVPAGLAVGLPSLRTRGVSLAIATLGLSVALDALVFQSESIAGGANGIPISADGSLRVFGFELDTLFHPHRFALLVLGFFVVLALMVANLRRGRAGRRLVAVRGNELAAASLGIDVVAAKLWAFGIGSAIAGVGGALVAYRNPSVVLSGYGILENVSLVAYAVIGGVGSALGALVGGLLEPGGVGNYLLTQVTTGWGRYINLVGGVTLLATVIAYPDGAVAALSRAGRVVGSRFRGAARRMPRRRETALPPPVEGRRRSSASTLVVEKIDVRFGGVHAVAGLSLSVSPGEVVALIGPNGAGKTTLIDAVTGFAPASGSIRLGDRELSGLPPHRRAALGLARTWQSVDLFEELTVLENLRVAADPADAGAYLVDLVRPGRGGLSRATLAAIEAFELAPHLQQRPDRLSAGTRRLVSMARAIAGEPSVLLLDEPCAGLDRHEREEVEPTVRALAAGTGIGVLLVEHDVDLVRRVADRAIAIDFGAEIAAGAPDEVLADPAVRRAYLGAADAPEPVTTSKEEA